MKNLYKIFSNILVKFLKIKEILENLKTKLILNINKNLHHLE